MTGTMRSWRRSGAAALLTVILLATVQAQPVREPAPGVLLVAAEEMSDPRFEQTVLLLVEHDRTGSWGLVINRPTQVDVAEMMPSVEQTGASKVYFGGPVRLDRLLFLHRDEPGANGGGTGVAGVSWSDSMEDLKARLARDPEGVRVYAGYAGWAPGQLAFELARGGWRMIQGRPENIFSDHPEGLWQRLTDALGGIAI